MSHLTDIAKIKLQEEALVFPGFTEEDALSIGLAVADKVKAMNGFALIDIRLWDRQLFAYSMPGAVADNAEWVRRKINVVRRYQISSYRMGLELAEAGRALDASRGVDALDYAAAGGCFPIRLQGGPIVGCITVSGLPQRDDHRVAVEAIAAHLGMDLEGLGLD
jgi:uncharacterized protein (UPF0303 family)